MFTVEELKAIVDEAHSTGFGKRVAAHAIDQESVRRAVEACVDSVEHGYGLTSID
jgi:imidazolonepropionase-like amidohydrolase